MSLWPDDMREDSLKTPKQILMTAAEELGERFPSLSVLVREESLTDRHCLFFEVSNAFNTLCLFEAYCAKGLPYPTLLKPPDVELPDYLKKRRIVRGSKPILEVYAEIAKYSLGTGGTEDRVIENDWVCTGPSEFTVKLRELLAMGYIRSRVLSLIGSDSFKAADPEDGADQTTAPGDG